MKRRVNQTPPENLFSVIHGVGATHAHPSLVEAKQRLKLTTLSWFGNIKSAPVEEQLLLCFRKSIKISNAMLVPSE
jgi:hypothetical protein